MLDYSEPNRAERSRPDVEKSWLLFEGVDTSLYDLMRKSKIEKAIVEKHPRKHTRVEIEAILNYATSVPSASCDTSYACAA